MNSIVKQVFQKYIYKIHSGRLRKAEWDLTLPLKEARRNDEIIPLADSQILRWIDELNGLANTDEEARNIQHQIRHLRKDSNSIQNKRKIQRLYAELDALQFKPDYMCLIIDKKKDYIRACKGFMINGVRYKRLLGTNGGVKNSTIVFVSERLRPELMRRIDNGRDPEKKLVTAKLEAYKALTCSASIPVSTPKRILIVNDAETEFTSDVIYLTDDSEHARNGEPYMELLKDEPISLNASDGFGLMSPTLASRWSVQLGLDYLVSGVNTRFSFEKGMVFTFDFVDFAEKVAGTYIVKDAWGNEVDIREVELILTTSMVKLWDSYESCEHYVETSLGNGYTFGVTKTCPKKLESERNLNYQFIQSYLFDDDDIEELIKPTMDEIKDVLTGDWRKTILFLKGIGLDESNTDYLEDDYAKAIMINPELINDPFIQSHIYQLIRNRINEAKVGVLKVHGNYSIVCGDPYLLCQSIFGMKETGLLKAGEVFNRYWIDCSDAKKLACYRAPMTTFSNIRLVLPVDNEEVRYWYRYMNTCTIFNSWDTATMALNGCDFDGDLVMLTDNDVLVRNLWNSEALMCVQRKAEKRVSTEEDFIQSNIDNFGNEIGQTTNWITSMFEVRANYEPGSPEYEMLSYRIDCGQLYQQNAIDKAKGIIAQPMPRSWHDRYAIKDIVNQDDIDLYRRIVADRKPYFMRYIYPDLMKQYNTYIKNTNRNALREFQMDVNQLKMISPNRLTQRQREFLEYYELKMPVGMSDCVMNKICRRFEEEFDGHLSRFRNNSSFDYQILKNNTEYTSRQFNSIKLLYDEYNKRVKSYTVFATYERVDKLESVAELSAMNKEFERECIKICPNREILCNIVLDICYQKNTTKRFAWNMCVQDIINNLLRKNDYKITFPTLSEDGDIYYGGKRFSLVTKEIEVNE